MTMLRKLVLGTVSVLALGIAGAALDYPADADDSTPNAGLSTPSTSGPSPDGINAAALSKDDVRWAQLELRNRGLYEGSLDGLIGPETKRALAEFQKRAGLARTAALDQPTADALVGGSGVGQGSSMQPKLHKELGR
jgi:peptidoglycan hydrolase-like protein with peptidoglycan-binding domain